MKTKFKVVISGQPTADENLVRALFGTDVKGLAAQISRGEWDHVINPVEGAQAPQGNEALSNSQ